MGQIRGDWGLLGSKINRKKKERSDLNSFGYEVELRKEKRKEKNQGN